MVGPQEWNKEGGNKTRFVFEYNYSNYLINYKYHVAIKYNNHRIN